MNLIYANCLPIDGEIAVPTSVTSNEDVYNEQESSNLDDAFLSGTFVPMSLPKVLRKR